MAELDLIATTTFGLEAVAKRELLSLGYNDLNVSDGRINFKADLESIPRANLWLRSADRVLLQMGEFKALTFEELFEKTRALPWDQWITKKGKFTVNGKSVKSKLYSVPDCQAIVKKAVVEKLKERYQVEWFEETGPDFTIQVALHKDMATLTIDTSGPGLHKRGYRQTGGEAPLKETLASAMVQLSFWNKDRLLLDPFCGSATIPIEAALIGRNIAPGLNRNFASEEWPVPGKDIWKKERVKAFHAIDHDTPIRIIASDIDEKAIKTAKENALQAGVDDCIEFYAKPFSQVQLKEKYVVVVTNPPYGERMGSIKEIHDLYREMGRIFKKEPTWSIYVLTPEEKFEQLYGARAHRRRKLYSGDIKVDYYQFYGERPPGK